MKKVKMGPKLWLQKLNKNSDILFKRHNLWDSIALTFILITGLFLRLKNISKITFWSGELIYINTAEKLKDNFFHPYLESGLELAKHKFLSYIIYLIDLISGVSSTRLFFSLLSLIAIILTFFISKKLYNRKIALINSFILAISPAYIFISQEIGYYLILYLLVLLLFITFISNINKIKKIIIISILSLLCISISTVFLPYVLIIVLFSFLNFKKISNPNKILLLILIFIASLFLSRIHPYNLSILLNLNYSYQYGLLALFLISIFSNLFITNRSQDKNIIFSSTLFIVFYFLFTDSLKDTFRHIIFLFPIALLFLSNLFILISSLKNKIIKISAYIVCFLIILTPTYLFVSNQEYSQEMRQKYTWTRPNYNYYKEFEIYNNSVILASKPIVTKYYVGSVDYGIKVTEKKLNIDPYTGVEYIDSLKDDRLTNYTCIQIFADYSENWQGEQVSELIENFIAYPDNHYFTVYYESKDCLHQTK